MHESTAVTASASTNGFATVIVIGGGPSGLMAADQLAQRGFQVHLYDAMPSVGRKFLLAGKGGLNLTHSEEMSVFASRYGARQQQVAAWLSDFGPDAVRQWAAGLGIDTFIGTSGRVFPSSLKAAPLLRAWLHRLRHYPVPVEFHMRHRWIGWSIEDGVERGLERNVKQGAQRASATEAGDRHSAPQTACTPPYPSWPACLPVWFEAPQGKVQVTADAVLLALGGASWPQLGSTGAWVPVLQARGVLTSALASANCGFDVRGGWSPFFSSRFAGHPFKSVAIHVRPAAGAISGTMVPANASDAIHAGNAEAAGNSGNAANGVAAKALIEPGFHRKGEFVATKSGVEGSLIYAASSLLRHSLQVHGAASFELDLLPDVPLAQVLREVAHPRGSRTLSSHLKSRLKLDGIKSAILHECVAKADLANPETLARAIKALPIRLSAARPVEEAISTAGGVRFDSLQEGLMTNGLPGVFCAGEMLDWEAPTGGYLLTACLSSGRRAAQGIIDYLAANHLTDQNFKPHPESEPGL